jgi:hypothetical protein
VPEYRNKGDSLRADRIAIQARSIDSVTIQKRTHGHKGQFATARDNAFCIIEIPLKQVLDKKVKK